MCSLAPMKKKNENYGMGVGWIHKTALNEINVHKLRKTIVSEIRAKMLHGQNNGIYKHSHKSPFKLGWSHHYFLYNMVVRITSKWQKFPWQESPQFSKLSSNESCYFVSSLHMDSNLRFFKVVAFKKDISDVIPHVLIKGL